MYCTVQLSTVQMFSCITVLFCFSKSCSNHLSVSHSSENSSTKSGIPEKWSNFAIFQFQKVNVIKIFQNSKFFESEPPCLDSPCLCPKSRDTTPPASSWWDPWNQPHFSFSCGKEIIWQLCIDFITIPHLYCHHLEWKLSWDWIQPFSLKPWWIS